MHKSQKVRKSESGPNQADEGMQEEVQCSEGVKLFDAKPEEKSLVKRHKRKRKTVRRGKKTKCKPMTNFILLHSNIRGLKSKLQSLNHAVNNVLAVSCISLNEHGYRGKSNIDIVNYHTFSKNRSNKRMGGV